MYREELEREYTIVGQTFFNIEKPIKLNPNIVILKEHQTDILNPPVASTSGNKELIFTLEEETSKSSEKELGNAVDKVNNNKETTTNNTQQQGGTVAGPGEDLKHTQPQRTVTDDASESNSASDSSQAEREEENSADKTQSSESPHKKEPDNNKKDGSDSDSNSGSSSGSSDNGSGPDTTEPGDPSGDSGSSTPPSQQGTPPAPFSSPSAVLEPYGGQHSSPEAVVGREGLLRSPSYGEPGAVPGRVAQPLHARQSSKEDGANLEESNYYSLLFYFLNVFNFLIEILTEIFFFSI